MAGTLVRQFGGSARVGRRALVTVAAAAMLPVAALGSGTSSASAATASCIVSPGQGDTWSPADTALAGDGHTLWWSKYEMGAAVYYDGQPGEGVMGQSADGKPVDVALIDSGVPPVPGLPPGNVVPGPDLSFESQSPQLAHIDSNGHGTMMASIIAGRDSVN